MGAHNLLVEHSKPAIKPRNLSREKAVINAVCDWIIEYVQSQLNADEFKSELHSFKKNLASTLRDSMESIHCANLRTTAENSKLYSIAASCNIPSYALPKDISIVVTQKSAYYFRKKSNAKNFILK